MTVTEREPTPTATVAEQRVSDQLPAAERIEDDPISTAKLQRRAQRRRLRARMLLVVILNGCLALGIVQVQARLERRGHVELKDAVLSADPVDVISTSPGNVVETFVRPGQRVTAGEVVAVVDAVRPAPAGDEQRVRTTLVSPVDGAVSAVPAKGGAAVRSGDIVVRLYRPETLHLEVGVPLDRTTGLELGMTGRFAAPGVKPLSVVLVGMEPGVAPGPDGRPEAHLQLQPVDATAVQPLLVGLPFDGWLRKGSAPDRPQPVPE